MSAKYTCVRTAHKPEQTLEEFRAARLAGFGGSDIADLFHGGEYSCQRRLFLERLDLMPPGKEGRLNHHIERGRFFEGPVAELFAKRTGWAVRHCGTGYIKELPFMRANADRLAHFPGETYVRPDKPELTGWGVMEIKCPGTHSFRKMKKEGLPSEYILQLQWQMFCYGTTWGVFVVFCAETFELEWFVVDRDQDLINKIQAQVAYKWGVLTGLKDFLSRGGSRSELEERMVEVGAQPIDSHSRACQSCPAFEDCHGKLEFREGVVIHDPDLAPVADRFLGVKEQLKALEKEEKELKAQLRDAAANQLCDYLQAGRFKVKVSERSRETVSSEVKKILTEEQKAFYVRNTTYEVVDVKRSEGQGNE